MTTLTERQTSDAVASQPAHGGEKQRDAAVAVEPRLLSVAKPYRFTVEQYLAMGKAGILGKEERVELLEGVIVAMAAMGNRHLAAVARFNKAFTQSVSGRAIVWVQGAIQLDDNSRPEPDVALLRERSDFYESQAAGPEDVLLLVEVSDSSADHDRYDKLPRYARAGIPEVWLTILPERVIEAHTEPVGGRYTQLRTYRPGDTISPGSFPDITLNVSEILPSQS